jgi:hypothetical protein
VAAAMFITAESHYGFIQHLDTVFAAGKSPLLQVVDWDSIDAQIPPRVDAVAALRWYDAGKIGFALRSKIPVTVFGIEPHEFGVTKPAASFLGKNVLVVAMPGNVTDIHAQYAPYFKTLEPGPALVVMHHGSVLLVIPTFIGTDLLAAPGQK